MIYQIVLAQILMKDWQVWGNLNILLIENVQYAIGIMPDVTVKILNG